MVASSDASSSKAPQNNNTLSLDEKTAEKQPQQSQVNVLEEDDEFEEFAEQGTCRCSFYRYSLD